MITAKVLRSPHCQNSSVRRRWLLDSESHRDLETSTQSPTNACDEAKLIPESCGNSRKGGWVEAGIKLLIHGGSLNRKPLGGEVESAGK